MKVYVEVSKDRRDLFDESDEIDVKLLKKEIEDYYGFEAGYHINPKENAIIFFNKGKVKRLLKMGV